MLRGVGLNEKELEILGVKYAGSSDRHEEDLRDSRMVRELPPLRGGLQGAASPWPGNIVKAFALAGDEIYNRVRVEGDNIVSFAANCRHCAKPKCVEGCISGAMATRPCNRAWSRVTRRVAWAAARA